jgi:hypothetical protein
LSRFEENISLMLNVLNIPDKENVINVSNLRKSEKKPQLKKRKQE